MTSRAMWFAGLAVVSAPQAAAQAHPGTVWSVGLGIGHSAAGRGGGSGTWVGVQGGLGRMVTATVGFEVEARLVAGEAATADAGCIDQVDGGECLPTRTLIPAELVAGEARLAIVPVPRLRLAAGPSMAWAPRAEGPRARVVAGLSGGIAVSPFRADGRGPAVELRETRFFSTLGEVR